MWKADKRLEVSFGAFSMPILIIHGTADHATLPTGSRFFFDRAGSTDKTLKLYDGHYHDLLADTGKEGVMADILGWIAARLPAKA
jgi:alpha-beta hydrolase superfamily lysophospholipase